MKPTLRNVIIEWAVIAALFAVVWVVPNPWATLAPFACLVLLVVDVAVYWLRVRAKNKRLLKKVGLLS